MIAMHVSQLLGNLSLRVDIEIVIASLPEAPPPSRPFPKVSLRFGCPFRQQASSYALFQHLHGKGNGFALWFGNQDMNVLGHYYEADHIKGVAWSYLLEHFKKDVTGTSASK